MSDKLINIQKQGKTPVSKNLNIDNHLNIIRSVLIHQELMASTDAFLKKIGTSQFAGIQTSDESSIKLSQIIDENNNLTFFLDSLYVLSSLWFWYLVFQSFF